MSAMTHDELVVVIQDALYDWENERPAKPESVAELVKVIETQLRAHEVIGAVTGLITYAEAIETSTDPLALVRLDSVAVMLRKSAHRIKQNEADTNAIEEMLAAGQPVNPAIPPELCGVAGCVYLKGHIPRGVHSWRPDAQPPAA